MEFSAIDLSLTAITILVVAALIAGFIDTLVGGGGLITIPALMMVGVPPIYALGTNKLQACVGSGTATFNMLRHGKVRFKDVRIWMLMALIGSVFGTVLVQFIDADALSVIVPIILLLIAFYFLLVPAPQDTEQTPKLSRTTYGATAVPTVGFYDGMFGPGTGSFFVLAGVSLRGQTIVNATVVAKTLNFATNIASLAVFIWFGKLLWIVGGLMMIGQFIGATIGSRVLFVINPKVLRALVIVICVLMLIIWFVDR